MGRSRHRGGQIRTDDRVLPKHVRYQAALRPAGAQSTRQPRRRDIAHAHVASSARANEIPRPTGPPTPIPIGTAAPSGRPEHEQPVADPPIAADPADERHEERDQAERERRDPAVRAEHVERPQHQARQRGHSSAPATTNVRTSRRTMSA